MVFLRQFLRKFGCRSPQTTQVLKFQKIAQEQIDCLRQTRVELDQEKAESEFLKSEVERLKKDKEAFKKQLDEAKQKLNSKADPISTAEIEELRRSNQVLKRKVVDNKDEEKYYRDIGEKYDQMLETNKGLEAKIKSQNNKLAEGAGANVQLESQLFELKVVVDALQSEKAVLEETVGELKTQLEEFLEMRNKREIEMDVSIENPPAVCLSPPKTVDSAGNEVIGHTVILELQGQVAKQQDDINAKAQEIESLKNSIEGMNAEHKKAVENHVEQVDAFNVRFGKQEAKIGDLQAANEKLLNSNNESKRKITNLQKNCDLYHQSYLTEKQNADERTSEVMDLSAKLKVVQKEAEKVVALNSKVEELQCQVTDGESYIKKLSGDNEAQRDEIDAMKGLIEQSKTTIENLTNEYENEQDRLKTEMENLTAEKNHVIQKLETDFQELTELKNRLVDEHQQSLEKKDAEMNQLMTTIENLGVKQVEMANEAEIKLKQTMKEMNDLVESKEHQFTKEVEIQKKQFEDYVAKSEAETNGLQEQVQHLAQEAAKVEVLSGELVQVKQDKNNVEQRLLQTESKKVEAEEKAMGLGQELASMEQRLSDAEANKTESEKAALEVESSLKNQINELTSKFEEKQEELDGINKLHVETMDQHKVEIEDYQKEVVSFEAKLSGLSETLATVQASEAELRQEKEALEAQFSNKLNEYQEGLTKEKQCLDDKTNELHAAQKEIQHLSDKSARLANDLEEVCKLLKSVESEKTALEKKHAETTQKSTTSNQTLKAELEKAKVDFDSQAATVKTLTEQLENTLFENDNHSRTIANLQDEKTSLEEQIEDMQANLTSRNEEVKSLLIRYEEADMTRGMEADKVEKLEEEVSKLSKQLESKEDEVVQPLCAKLNEVQEENSTHLERQKVLQREIESLSSTIASLNEKLIAVTQGQLSKSEAAAVNIRNLEIKLQEKDEEVGALNDAMSKLREQLSGEHENLVESQYTVETRTQECKQLLSSVTDLQQFLSEEKDQNIEMKKHVEQSEVEAAKMRGEHATIQEELTERIRYLEQELADKKQTDELASKATELEESKDRALKEQKERYEGRVKQIAEDIKKQYQNKINESVAKWKSDVAAKDEQIAKLKAHVNDSVNFEEKYTIAKEKMAEVAAAAEKTAREKAELQGKYQASKEAIRGLQDDLKKADPNAQLKNDSLQREMNLLRNELRSLKVQNMAADQKIRELQAQQHEKTGVNTRRQTMAMTRTKSTSDESNFKMPCVHKHTPGRAKHGRTQSEASMPRRPPLGSGSMFQADDEAGEMFSNSYLSDLKDGRCSIGGPLDPSRLSELARRNTMVPAHLKSSYPAETQFFKPNEFNDRDLQKGLVKDVSLITDKTAELTFDSPAMNTRTRARKPSPDENKPTRKRRSTTNPSELRFNDSNVSDSSMTSIGSKRTRREQNMVSYSRPGLPTPAKTKGNKSMNSSDTSITSYNSNMVSLIFFKKAKKIGKTQLNIFFF